MKWCTNCQTNRESRYEGYSSGSDWQCWYCDGSLTETRTISNNTISCGSRHRVYSSETRYCQHPGCFTQVSGDITYGNYCSSHSSQSSGLDWGYSYSSSGSICQAEDCSRRTSSSGETYCEVCKPIQVLNRKVENKTSIRPVKDTVEFVTWWNNNLATVVNGDGYFSIWLLVYDDKENRIREFSSNSGSYNLSNIKNQASNLRINLDGNNPILYIHPKANTYASFGEIVSGNYVKKIDIPYDYDVDSNIVPGIYQANPDNYLEPLDIVRVKKILKVDPFFGGGAFYYHFCIYLGDKQVCHISGEPDTRKRDQYARIESWSAFSESGVGDLTGHRLIIPFRHRKDIVANIARADGIRYGEGDYKILSKNCEHFVNMVIYGIKHSEQVGEGNFKLSDGISMANQEIGLSSDLKVQQIERRVQNVVPIKRNWI